MIKKISIALFFVAALWLVACDKDDDKSDRFLYLTGNVWLSDSLYVIGADESYSAGFLDGFRGEANFNEDGSGTFGEFAGTWSFAQSETRLILETDSLPVPITANIDELTNESLRLTSSVPNPDNPFQTIDVRMTFIARQ